MSESSPSRFVVGITGHRDLEGRAPDLRASLRALLEIEQTHHRATLTALSALARGADTIFAEVALELGIPLQVVLPFADYAGDFEAGAERDRFLSLVGAADRVETLPNDGRTPEAYAEAGRWIVDRCDLLLAVWDGGPGRGPGGTADTVAYARSVGRRLTIIPDGGPSVSIEPEASDHFAEYSFFAKSTEGLADRRQVATQVYMAVNTLLFAVLGFLLKDAATGGRVLLLTSLPLLVIGFAACMVWWRTLLSYKALIAWRYDELMAMEGTPELGWTRGFYTREWEDFFGPRIHRRRLRFTNLEAWLPIMIGAIHLALALGLVFAVMIEGWRS